MEEIFREHPNFDDARFQRDVFGIDYYPPEIARHVCERKPGWMDWRDVQEYFGLGSRAVDPYALKRGYMSDKLYQALAGKLGEERVNTFFGTEKTTPKVSKSEQDIEDLATLLVGTPDAIREMRARRGNKPLF